MPEMEFTLHFYASNQYICIGSTNPCYSEFAGEVLDTESQEYDDFLNWMEKSLMESNLSEVQTAAGDGAQGDDEEEAIEEELETLPEEPEVETSGNLETAEDIISPNSNGQIFFYHSNIYRTNFIL